MNPVEDLREIERRVNTQDVEAIHIHQNNDISIMSIMLEISVIEVIAVEKHDYDYQIVLYKNETIHKNYFNQDEVVSKIDTEIQNMK